MVAIADRYLVLGGTVPRQFRDKATALGVHARLPEAILVVIADSTEDLDSLTSPETGSTRMSRFREMQSEVGDPHSEFVERFYPLPGLSTDGESARFGMAWIVTARRVVLIELLPDQAVGSQWPSNLVPISQSSVVSLILRIGNGAASASKLETRLSEEFDHLVAIQAAIEQQDLYRRLAESLLRSDEKVEQRQELFSRAIISRGRYANLLVALHTFRSFSPQTESVVRQTIADLDALIGSHAGVLLLQIQRSTALENERAGQRAERSQAAEARLARVVAALILPTLWLSLLGTNVLPAQILGVDVPSAVALQLTIAGTVGFSIGGYYVVGLFSPRKERNRHDSL